MPLAIGEFHLNSQVLTCANIQKGRSMRFIRKSLVGLFLFSVTLGLLAYSVQMVKTAISDRMTQETRAPQPRERTFTVNVMRADPATLSPTLDVFGEVQSRRTLDLRMATAGQVVFLAPNFIEGGQIQTGQVLVRLDDANAQSALARARADLMDAQAEISEAERAIRLAADELDAALAQASLRDSALARQLDLQKRGVSTAAAVEAAQLAASSAQQSVLVRRSSVDQAQARKSLAQTRLARAELATQDAERRVTDTVLTAQFSGTLAGVTLVQGGLVGVNERIGQLIDPTALEVAFRVSTEQYSRLLDPSGQLLALPVDITLSSTGRSLVSQGVLSRDSGSVAQGQTGRLLFARIENPIGLKPGDFVTVSVQEPEIGFAVRLPATALSPDQTVLVVGDDNRLQSVSVTLLRRQGNDVIVRSRDLAGRDVVMQQTPLLGKGIKVKVLRGDGLEVAAEPTELVLSPERRAKLIAFVEANKRMPQDAKTRILTQLNQEKVPVSVVERLESRM